MNGESRKFQVAPESVLPTGNELQTAESTSQFNAHGFNNFQYSQPLAEAPSSNENNTWAPVYSNCYYTSHADAQRQPNELTCEQGTQSGVALGQDVLSHGNAEPTFPATTSTTSTYHADYQVHDQNYQQAQEQHFSRQAVIEYSSNDVNALAPVLAPTSTESPPAIIINSSKSPILALGDEAADNSNLTFGNYEFCGSSPANTTTRPLDNPEAQAMNFADNRLQAEARYSPNMQAEGINTVQAHQWHERREKLPTTPDSAFYAEWQTNRAPVVNTAEIQNARKLLFLQRRAAEKKKKKKKKKRELGQVNQRPESSTPKQVEQQQEQPHQPHQPHHLYQLHQVQQQNHSAALAPDGLSSPQQFVPSPMSAISSTGSGQQAFPHAHPAPFPQMQMQEALMPNGGNAMYHPLANPLQQLLMMQALQQQQQQQQQQQKQQQQQYLQQALSQPCKLIFNSDFFDNWQKCNQQRYGEALKEHTVRHKGINSSGQGPKRRKRQNRVVDVTDDKENISMGSEWPLIIDESTVQPSSVQLKCDGDLGTKLAGYEGQVEESVMKNVGATKKSTSKRGKGGNRGEPSKDESATADLTGMWLNDFAMVQDWLNMQQQSVDQRESGMVQCENSSME